jgi:molybdopterin-guanine dinucleotide biosynthesis protein B
VSDATPVLAISGPSGVGKTTLLVKLIPALMARGLRVAALKRSGHPHTFDRPRKDSARLRRAGAVAVAVQGPVEVAYFGPPVGGLRALARLLPPSDLILAEGFKTEALPRVEVHRRAVDASFLCARDPRVVAVVSDEQPPRRVPWFTARDIDAIAEFAASFALKGRRARGRALASGGPRGQRSDREAGASRDTSMARTRSSSSSRGPARSRTGQGRAGARRVGAATVREAGRKGGRVTLERRGPEFYSRIGRKGGKSSGGSRRAAAAAAGRGAATRRGGGARGGKRTR